MDGTYPWRVKMRLFIALMLVSLNVFAVEWNDIQLDQNLKITQSFQLKQKIAAGSLIDIVSGEDFVVKDIIGLDMIKVVLFELSFSAAIPLFSNFS
jgi:hypothetical protein